MKVLDFGLAKLNEPVAASRETELPTGEARTGAGVILGTAAYMSPEQAEGKPVDARSDIFSFGAVLYEMATGRRAFAGDSWVSTVSAVLHQEPKPLEGLPHDLERVIQRCLRKDPAKRITNHRGFDVVPTWSRDGRWVYFTSDRSGSRQIWKMPAEGGDASQVTRHGGVNAMESADGGTVYFAKDIDVPGLWRMPVGGGDETAVPDAAAGAVWGQMALTEGGIYFIARDGTDVPLRYAIYFSDFASRKTTRIYRLANTLPLANPGLALSPDRRALLFTQLDASGADLMLLENFR